MLLHETPKHTEKRHPLHLFDVSFLEEGSMHLNISILNSIKARVTVFTLAIFLISIWSLQFYASRMLREDMQRMLGEQLFSTVSVVAADINQELEDRVRNLEKVAAKITPAMLESDTATQRFLNDRPILPALFNGGSAVYRSTGTVIADSIPSAGRIGNNYLDVDTVAAALREGKSTIGQPVIGKKLQAPIISIGVPIRDAQGTVIGGMGGIINLSRPNFLDKISENHYGKTGGYVLVAPQHKLFVTATDKSLIMQPTPAPGVNPLLDRYVQGFEGSGVVVDSRGVEVLSSAKQIPAAGWFLVARIPAAEAFAPIRSMQQRILLTTTFLTLLAGCLTWWMLKQQLSPLLSTTKELAALSGSDRIPPPLPVGSQDEIGQLIGSFNRLLEAVTQRENSLKESESTFRKLFEESFDPILLINSTGAFVECNQAALNLLGMTREQFMFLPLARISPELQPDGRRSDEAAEEMIALAHAKGLHRFDWTCVNSTGDEFIVNISLMPITISGQTMLHATWRDITEHKRAEEERNRLEQQLQQARKMESVGRLAGGVAHDFNNMLSIIISHAYLGLLKLDKDHPAREDLKQIHKTAESSADLTRQLLAFARKQTVAPVTLDLNASITSMIKMLQRLISEDIQFVRQLAPDLWQIRMDPSQLDQILANLCVNARDAIEGSGTITIETENCTITGNICADCPEAMPGDYVRLSVKDNGCGMDAETLAHVFEPFFTTKELGKGTGLGLSTVYGAIRQNNGFITIASTPGQGTAINIYLPKDAECRTGQLPAEPPTEQLLPPSRKTILLVEDEEAILKVTATMLEHHQYCVLKAHTPEEALQISREYPGEIHLLMTDVIMPAMNGRDLAGQLQAGRPGMRCLYMSGYTADVIAQHGVLDNGIHFMQKPFSATDMLVKIQQALGSDG